MFSKVIVRPKIKAAERPSGVEDQYKKRQLEAIAVFRKHIFPKIVKEMVARYKECKCGIIMVVTVGTTVAAQCSGRHKKPYVQFHRAGEVDPYLLKVAGGRRPVTVKKALNVIVMFSDIVIRPVVEIKPVVH